MESITSFRQPTEFIKNGLTTFVMATILSFSSGISADDTEIFFGQIETQANVLFILDVSGSMDWTDGTMSEPGPTRLSRLKDALDEIISTTNDINVGLLTFEDINHRLLQEIAPITENRDQLLATINGLTAGGNTPTIGALYRGGQYFRGEPVRQSNQINTLGEYTVAPDNFENPMQSECQTNHIVLLTDGAPSEDSTSVAEVETAIFPAGFGLTCTTPDELAGGKCGVELATWLATTNHSDTLPGLNNVITHTIGFNFSKDWLKTVSIAGSGQHFNAESVADLVVAFDSILEQATDNSNSFVAPAITVDQFTRFSNRNDMYLALFQPSGSQRWSGNLKRYLYDGTVKGKDKLAALDTSTGAFLPEAHSFWSTTADGGDVASGGAASKIDSDDRNIYTYLGASANLTDASNKLHEDGPVTAQLLGVPTDERTKLLQWARGVDVDDEDDDPETTTRYHIGDPLHSKPAILTYGGPKATPDSTVFIGTNDGFLHAIDSRDGTEVFSFVPSELLQNLDAVYDDDRTINRVYGIDGDLTLWVNDADNNGTISTDTTEHAYLYMGMRRGGDFYYALDVTAKSNPQYLWSVKQGDTGFEKLGQSWSKPTLSKVSIGGSVTDVLIFGGGYDSALDNSNFRSPDTVGNDLYIVNAETGDLLWNTSTAADTTPYDDNMLYSIPSDPRIIDINGDGIVDQIYIGDMGGQVWRFDVDTHAVSAAKLVKGGVIANLAGNDPADNRRFFYPPDVAQIEDESSNFLSIAIGTGNRANPLGTSVDDRFYMIRQKDILSAPKGYGMIDPIRSTSEKTYYRAITEDDLYDTTENLIGSAEVTIANAAAETLRTKKGWLLTLPSAGEKVLASSLTVNNQVMFTTYVPQVGESDSCAPVAGIGRIYKVSVLDASPMSSGTTHEDRYSELSTSGIANEPTPFIDEDGNLTILVGLETVDTPTFQPTTRVFWTEEPDY